MSLLGLLFALAVFYGARRILARVEKKEAEDARENE